MIFLCQLFLEFLGNDPLFLGTAIPIPVSVAISVTTTVTTTVSVIVSVAISVPIAISGVSIVVSIVVSLLAFLVSLVPFKITESLAFLTFFFALPPSLVSLILSLEFCLLTLSFFLFALLFDNSPLLFFDRKFFLSQLLSYSFAFCTSGFGVGGIFLVCSGSFNSLCFGCFFTELRSPSFANALFNRAIINQLANDSLGFLVNPGALQSAIDESCSLSPV